MPRYGLPHSAAPDSRTTVCTLPCSRGTSHAGTADGPGAASGSLVWKRRHPAPRASMERWWTASSTGTVRCTGLPSSLQPAQLGDGVVAASGGGRAGAAGGGGLAGPAPPPRSSRQACCAVCEHRRAAPGRPLAHMLRSVLGTQDVVRARRQHRPHCSCLPPAPPQQPPRHHAGSSEQQGRHRGAPLLRGPPPGAPRAQCASHRARRHMQGVWARAGRAGSPRRPAQSLPSPAPTPRRLQARQAAGMKVMAYKVTL